MYAGLVHFYSTCCGSGIKRDDDASPDLRILMQLFLGSTMLIDCALTEFYVERSSGSRAEVTNIFVVQCVQPAEKAGFSENALVYVN